MPARPPATWSRLLLGTVAVAYAAIGLSMLLLASPKVPYADPWRFLATFLDNPFPANVLAADNGHREVLPNLLRVAELHWLGANQWLQIGTGFVLALGVLGAFTRAWRGAEPTVRAAATAIVCIGLFWLGNGRKLAHGNEMVHLFLVLGCLVVGLRALTRLAEREGAGPVWLAGALGFAATLSFGSGIATFPAFAALLALQRTPWRRWLPLFAVGALAAAALLLGGGGRAAKAEFDLVAQGDLLLRWLGAPFVWACSPLLDPEHAARLPWAVLQAPCGAIARPVADAFGPHLAARWPGALFGGLGVLWLVVASVRLARRGDAAARERFALALGWFAVAVGALVVALRLSFFHAHPDQITSQRYVPWSMMLWTGLLLSYVLRPGRSPRAATCAAMAMALLLAPSQVWTGRYAWKQQRTAHLTALGAAVGVLDPRFDLVETDPKDLLRAVPLLRERRATVFGWPETLALGTQPAAEHLAMIAIGDVQVEPVDNRFGAPGCRVSFAVDGDPAAVLVLLDPAGSVQGLAWRLAFEDRWTGWWRGGLRAADLRAAALR